MTSTFYEWLIYSLKLAFTYFTMVDGLNLLNSSSNAIFLASNNDFVFLNAGRRNMDAYIVVLTKHNSFNKTPKLQATNKLHGKLLIKELGRLTLKM